MNLNYSYMYKYIYFHGIILIFMRVNYDFYNLETLLAHPWMLQKQEW